MPVDDAGALDALPGRGQDELDAERWQDELRQMQRHRADSDFYSRLIYRRTGISTF